MKRGELLTSIKALSDVFQWSRDKVYRFLDALEEDKTIQRKSTPHYTVIKVLNYDLYQVNRQPTRQPGIQPTETYNKENNEKQGLISNLPNFDID